jgi:hypothetical protein
MKKNLLLPLLLFVAMVATVSTMQGQCTPDPQYTSQGIYPSDTLLDLQVGDAYSEVVHFVFPNDTVYQGFQLDFDSFGVNSISNIPPGLNWECDNNHPVCSYVVNQAQVTRGCVTIFGTPTSPSSAYPGYDSTIVDGTGWVTIFNQPTPIPVEIPIYYRTEPMVNVGSGLDEQVGLEVTPNPISSNSVVRYNLPFAGDVSIGLYNAYGQEVHSISKGAQSGGSHTLPVSLNAELAAGVYFLRFSINGGEFVTTKKLISTN